jgi:hypothetical protein
MLRLAVSAFHIYGTVMPSTASVRSSSLMNGFDQLVAAAHVDLRVWRA